MSKSIVPNLTQDELKRLLDYDPETGVFRWRVKKSAQKKAGSVAGTTEKQGYRTIRINRRMYKAHRLAWLYMNGVWPDGETDHINQARDDNRWANLRDVSKNENQHNRRGTKGYSRHGSGWAAKIKSNNVDRHIGTFYTEAEARAAYLAAKKIYHPTAPHDIIATAETVSIESCTCNMGVVIPGYTRCEKCGGKGWTAWLTGGHSTA